MSHQAHTPDDTGGTFEEARPPISAQQFQELAEMIGADMPEILVDVLETYLEESADLVATIGSTSRIDDGQEMLRPAHSLKSSSASVGAMHLSILCDELESYLRGGGGEMDIHAQAEEIEHEFQRVQAALAVQMENLQNT